MSRLDLAEYERAGRKFRFGKLDVHVWREGRGPTVVLGHGIPTSGYLYREILPVLARSNDVVTFDWPGFGLSSKPKDFSYRYADYEKLFTDLLSSLRVERLSLVVHDLAGPILLDWLSRNPERVERLVVLNTTLYPKHWRPPKLAMMQAVPVVRTLVRPFLGDAAFRRILKRASPGIPETALDAYTKLLHVENGRRALFRVYATMPKSFGDIKGVRHRLKSGWKGPTHLVWGTRDPILPIENAHAFRKDLPQATLATIAAGHFLQEERPAEVAAEIAGFLSAA